MAPSSVVRIENMEGELNGRPRTHDHSHSLPVYCYQNSLLINKYTYIDGALQLLIFMFASIMSSQISIEFNNNQSTVPLHSFEVMEV